MGCVRLGCVVAVVAQFGVRRGCVCYLRLLARKREASSVATRQRWGHDNVLCTTCAPPRPLCVCMYVCGCVCACVFCFRPSGTPLSPGIDLGGLSAVRGSAMNRSSRRLPYTALASHHRTPQAPEYELGGKGRRPLLCLPRPRTLAPPHCKGRFASDICFSGCVEGDLHVACPASQRMSCHGLIE